MGSSLGIYKLFLLIFLLSWSQSCEAFANNFSDKNTSFKHNKSNFKKKNKKQIKPKKILSETKSRKIKDEEMEEDDDKFDYEELYRNSTDDKINSNLIEKNQPLNDPTLSAKFNELSDFGVIKDTVGEKKIIKRYDSEDDEIFLNKDIFDEKNKSKLRKSAPPEPVVDDKKFKIFNRLVNDLSLARNYGNADNNFFDTTGVVRYFSSIKLGNSLEFYGLFRLSRFDNNNDIAKRDQDQHNAGSRTFENMGIGMSELSVKFSKNNSSIIAGKFTANFGTAWRWNKAIAVHNIPQNYALTEKLGVTAITKYGDIKKSGLYNFSLSFFTNDRKNFDNTLFHRRESPTKSQALAGDTRSLGSYAFATDISFDFSDREKLRYHIGYSRLGVNSRASSVPRDLLKKQQGIVFGMNYEFPINKDFSGETILEHAKIKNPDGNSSIQNNYLTTNFILKYLNKYSLMAGNSYNKNISNINSHNNISEVNIGYEFSKNKYFDRLTTQVGYHQNIEKNAIFSRKNKALAILIRYYKNF